MGEDFSFLRDLPPEIYLWVIRYLSRGDLAQMCLVSKTINEDSTKELYRIVDLSWHNTIDKDVDQYRMEYHCEPVLVPPDHPDYKRISQRPQREAFRRQQNFIRTILKRPQLGGLTRTFKWTIDKFPTGVRYKIPVILPEIYADDSLRSLNSGNSIFGEPQQPYWDYFSAGDPLWQIFLKFTHVSSVDLACVEMTGRERDNAPPLFLSANSIRLTGLFSHNTLESILRREDSTMLRHLDLNNVHTFADPENRQQRHSSSGEMQPLRASRQRTAYDHLVGPLQGHLTYLIARPCFLTSLRIQSVGRDRSNIEWKHAHHDHALSDAMARSRYREYARFIKHVTPTICYLAFEQGMSIDAEAGRTGGGFRNRLEDLDWHHRPMDQWFEEELLPTILIGPWPRLRRLEILGIGKRDWNLSMPESTSIKEDLVFDQVQLLRWHIKSAVGKHVELHVQAEASKVMWDPEVDIGHGMYDGSDEEE